MLEAIRRRRRLEPHSRCGSKLTRYEDPETGKLYVARWRWDPVMVESVVNPLRGDAKE